MITEGRQKLIDSRITGITRMCPKCGKFRHVWYSLWKDGTDNHLAMFCPCDKPLTKWIKFEKGLSVPTFGAKIVVRKELYKLYKEQKEIGKQFQQKIL